MSRPLPPLLLPPTSLLPGACVENTLLSRQGLLNYSKLPSMTVVQGELVSGLTMLTSQTSSLLHRHPAHLSVLLQQYLTQQSSGGGAGVEGGSATEASPKPEETA